MNIAPGELKGIRSVIRRESKYAVCGNSLGWSL